MTRQVLEILDKQLLKERGVVALATPSFVVVILSSAGWSVMARLYSGPNSVANATLHYYERSSALITKTVIISLSRIIIHVFITTALQQYKWI